MDAAGVQVWFVAFLARKGLDGTAWWARLLHPGYTHVLACQALTADTTLVVNHTGTRLHTTVENRGAGFFLRDLQERAGAWVLVVELDAQPGAAALRGPMTCVEAVKAALGIRAPLAITPRQLARHLRRHADARALLPIVPTPEQELTPEWVAS